MGFYVGLTNYRPSGRSDGLKWTSVGIFEAPSVDGAPGAWTEIDTQALADYPSALAPPVFSFSTVNGTAPSGLWYKVQFRDSGAGIQEGVPEYNGTAAAPDVEWVRDTSDADFAELGYPEPVPGDPDRLQTKLDEAVLQFYAVTGIDPRTMPEADKRVTLVRMAIRMMTEWLAASGQMEQLETASDYDMLSAMSASGYSETRRGVVRPNPQVLHPWPAADRLLNWIVNFDTQGGAVEEAPGVGAPRSPSEVRKDMREFDPPRYPIPLSSGVPYWPRPYWPGEEA